MHNHVEKNGRVMGNNSHNFRLSTSKTFSTEKLFFINTEPTDFKSGNSAQNKAENMFSTYQTR